MEKRKEPPEPENSSEDESSSDDDVDMVNVDFEWFDPQPAYDFHGLKTLLRQLFDIDAQLFDLSSLADLILAQPLLGSTVKVEGHKTDPYAFLTILNLREHREKPFIQTLASYFEKQASTNPDLKPIVEILKSSSDAQIGLILTERLVNIPSEVVPPMYRMLLEEISWAVDEKEPYTFTHFLIISKTYQEVISKLDSGESRPRKKKRKETNAKDNEEIFFFHPEDQVLHEYAIAYGNFPYLKQEADGQADAKRAFQELGIKAQGHLMLVEASKGEAMVKALESFLR